MSHLVGLRFDASLGKAWPPKDAGEVLLELDLTATEGPIKCSHTGGDIWCLPAGSGAAAAAASAAGPSVLAEAANSGPAPPPMKCNAWDCKGRNPAMNIYVHLYPPGGATGSEAEAPPRCKLGVLIQHALPRLAMRVGGYGQVALDWVTWITQSHGAPLPSTVSPFGMTNPAHWLLLQELAKEKETGAGMGIGRCPLPDSAEDLALRRAKDTLVAAATHFGPEAVAKVSRLTVRKLYQREYHFFDADGKDIADSRRHALEWAVGLQQVEDVLSVNAEARSKLNERLTGPSAGAAGGGGATSKKRPRPPTSSSNRRVVLSAAGSSFHRAVPGSGAEVAAVAGGAPAVLPNGVGMAAAGLGQPLLMERSGSMHDLQPAQQQQQLLTLLAQMQQQGPQQGQGQAAGPPHMVMMPQASAVQQQALQSVHSPRLQLQPVQYQPQPPPPMPAPPVPQPAMEQQPGMAQLMPVPMLQPLRVSQPMGQQRGTQQQQQHGCVGVGPPGAGAGPPTPVPGLSDLLQGTPSWLGPDVQLCPPQPTVQSGSDGNRSPSSEVEQASPVRFDAPVPLLNGEGNSRAKQAQQAQQAVHAAQQALHAAHAVQQAQQAAHAAQQVQQAAYPLHQQQHAYPPHQQHQQVQQQMSGVVDSAMPAPVKRPRLEPPQQQQHQLQPGDDGATARLPPPAGLQLAVKNGVVPATAAAGAADGSGEVVPLDTVLEAWEAHDRVNRQLAEVSRQLGEAQQALERQRQEAAEAERQRDTLQRQLAAAHTQLAAAPSSPSKAGGSMPPPTPAPSAAATMAAAAAVQAQLSDLRVLLPRSVRLHLSHLLGQAQPEVQAHSVAVCDLGCQAAELALASYASALTAGAAPPTMHSAMAL